MIHEDLWAVIYDTIDAAEDVIAADAEVSSLVADLEVKLTEMGAADVFDTIDPLLSAITALQGEATKAAWLLGFKHGRNPELLIFKGHE